MRDYAELWGAQAQAQSIQAQAQAQAQPIQKYWDFPQKGNEKRKKFLSVIGVGTIYVLGSWNVLTSFVALCFIN